jgi:hypothetical protein
MSFIEPNFSPICSYSLLIILFSLVPPEQGRQNDLLYLKGHDKSPKNYGPPFFIIRVSTKCNHIKEQTSLVAHCLSLSKVIIDRVHCDPLSFVACGSSCHTVDFVMKSNDVHQGVKQTSLVAHCHSSSKVISDRVHCDPLSSVACEFSCHTPDFLYESNDVHQGVKFSQVWVLPVLPPMGPCLLQVICKLLCSYSMCSSC